MKKIISLLLVLSMLLCVLPAASATGTDDPYFVEFYPSLNDSIALKFRVKNYQGCYVTFQKGSGDEGAPNYGENGVFTFDDLTAKDLDTKITARIYKDGTLVESTDETKKTVVVRSVEDYCIAKLNTHQTSGNLRQLVVDLLKYGAACETYFGDTSTVGELTTLQEALGSQSVPNTESIYAIGSQDAYDVKFNCAGLTPEESVAIYYEFKATDINGGDNTYDYFHDDFSGTETYTDANSANTVTQYKKVNGQLVFSEVAGNTVQQKRMRISIGQNVSNTSGAIIEVRFVVNGDITPYLCLRIDGSTHCNIDLSGLSFTSGQQHVLKIVNDPVNKQYNVYLDEDRDPKDTVNYNKDNGDVFNSIDLGAAAGSGNLEADASVVFEDLKVYTGGEFGPLSLKVTKDGSTTTYSTSDFESLGNDTYKVYYRELNPTEMSAEVVAQAFRGETPVSAALTYSIESYAHWAMCEYDGEKKEELAALAKAMMTYGASTATWDSDREGYPELHKLFADDFAGDDKWGSPVTNKGGSINNGALVFEQSASAGDKIRRRTTDLFPSYDGITSFKVTFAVNAGGQSIVPYINLRASDASTTANIQLKIDEWNIEDGKEYTLWVIANSDDRSYKVYLGNTLVIPDVEYSNGNTVIKKIELGLDQATLMGEASVTFSDLIVAKIG